jgi:hypothetical protein
MEIAAEPRDRPFVADRNQTSLFHASEQHADGIAADIYAC